MFNDIATTTISIYATGITHLDVDGRKAYDGPTLTDCIRHFTGGPWAKGQVSLSDGTRPNYWKINNIGRSTLVGGLD